MGETGEFEALAAQPRYGEFRQYLEEKQLMNELTKILVQLYETNEKPANPTAFCRDHFSRIDGVDIDVINAENQRLAARLEELKGKLEALEKELAEATG
jgi:cob(I)alamin adenosyltransferase